MDGAVGAASTRKRVDCIAFRMGLAVDDMGPLGGPSEYQTGGGAIHDYVLGSSKWPFDIISLRSLDLGLYMATWGRTHEITLKKPVHECKL